MIDTLHGSDVTPGQMQEFWRQVKEGHITRERLTSFLKHEKEEEQKPRGRYANEVTESNYGYPKGYEPKSPADQLAFWSETLPRLSTDGVLELAEELAKERPKGAEALFIIPKWKRMADEYGTALKAIFAIIAGQRNFHNYRGDNLGPKYLRESQRTRELYDELGKTQTGDYWVIWAQFGFLHRGKSVRKVCDEFPVEEYGLGAFVIVSMLATHPERLVAHENLFIDCPGDKYAPDVGGDFSFAPLFDFDDGRLGFGANRVDYFYSRYGSASVFLVRSN